MEETKAEEKDWGENIKVAEEKKEEKDIEIDFGKITGIFKKKKQPEGKQTATHEAPKHETKQESGDEEIDLGKIAKIFKGGSKKETKEVQHEAGKEEELSLDLKKTFSKAKGIIKGLKGAQTGQAGEEGVEIASAVSFMKNHYSAILIAIAIIVSVGIGFSIRMQAGDLKFTDTWAKNTIDQAISSDISAYIGQSYPNLPEKNRNALISEELGKAQKAGNYQFKTGQFAGQTINIKQQTEATSTQFKTFFEDEKGRNYMPDIDPYYWLRYAKNIEEHGYAGDELTQEGRQLDNHQFAPTGREIDPQDTFYPKSIVYFHSIAKIFGPLFGADTELIRVLMFYPVFLSAIITILVFLIARRIAGNIAAFFAATMVGVHGALMNRTLFGHGDSDALVVLFSVLVLWLFIEAFNAKKTRLTILFGALSGAATGLYSLAWGGWWWIFDFVMAAAAGTTAIFIAYEAFLKIINRQKIQKAAITSLKDKAAIKAITATAAYFAATGIFITLFSGFKTFLFTPLASLGFAAIKTPVIGDAWPNVLRTVAELNEGTTEQAIQQLGNSLFYIAVIGIILIILRAAIEAIRKERDTQKIMKDIFYAAVLTIWLMATLYSVTKGIRFVLLMVPAFSIAFGAVFGITASYATAWLHKEFKFNKMAVTAAILAVFLMLFPGITLNSEVVKSSKNMAQNDAPLVNDAWYNALTAIKDNSDNKSIITSWWDFGHHFKAIADRPVTFDGTTQLSPQAHWVGRFFSTSDENEATGILRMLNCGARNAVDEIQKKENDSVKAILLTKRIILQDNENARNTLLNEGFSPQQTEGVLKYTHCTPPKSFVIASEDMISKSGVWAHFGGWNFTKADIWKATKGMDRTEAVKYMKGKFSMTEEEANSLFEQMQQIKDDRAADEWISPWPGFSAGVNGCSQDGILLRCGDGTNINLETHEAWYATPQGNLHPQSIVYPTEDGNIIEKKFDNNTLPQDISVILIPNKNGYNTVLASQKLAGGMFAKMFYLEGHGLSNFKLLTRQRGLTGTDIWVWEVNWDGSKQKNIMPALIKNAEVTQGDEVTLNYIGYLEDGTVFDSSIKDFRNKQVTKDTLLSDGTEYNPITFKTATNAVIPGFEKGIMGAKLNEEKTITIPPEEGYNQPGHPLYNKTLHFKIKVTAIR